MRPYSPPCRLHGLHERVSSQAAGHAQGGSVGHTFEQLAYIMERVEDQDRVGVCLDTCHMFAAGYDVSTAEGYEDTMAKFGDVVGFHKLKGEMLGCASCHHGRVNISHLGSIAQKYPKVAFPPALGVCRQMQHTPVCRTPQQCAKNAQLHSACSCACASCQPAPAGSMRVVGGRQNPVPQSYIILSAGAQACM